MSGLHISAGSNSAATQRLNLNTVKSFPKPSAAPDAAATFRLQDPQGARMQELMAEAGNASPEQAAALQGELDRLRSSLGAGANAPEVLATLAELSVASENVSAARSNLSDVSAARAAARMAQAQIRQYAPAAIQAQANAGPGTAQGLIGN
jgi:flagellin-like hook-associated protein FlgL